MTPILYRRWLVTTICVGSLYVVIGLASAELARTAASAGLRAAWRQSAFVASAIVFVAHIADEHFRIRSDARRTAWYASAAAALGGFGLALAANLHDVGSPTGYRPRMLIALFAWPLLMGVPAFVAALLLAAGLGMKKPRT